MKIKISTPKQAISDWAATCCLWTKANNKYFDNVLFTYVHVNFNTSDVGYMVLCHVSPCWAILSRRQHKHYAIQLYKIKNWIVPFHSPMPRGCLRGLMVKAIDCRIVVTEFKLQSLYYVHFQTYTVGKGVIPYLQAMGKIEPLLFL